MTNLIETPGLGLLTLDEARGDEGLRVSRPTLHRLIANGDLPVVEVGARTFVRRQDLDAFVAKHRVVRSPQK